MGEPRGGKHGRGQPGVVADKLRRHHAGRSTAQDDIRAQGDGADAQGMDERRRLCRTE